MIDFWARLDESDVEKYAKTLILPDYMSHLNLRPFSFSNQRESASGREPLTLLYVGDGRLEELELRPERDALPLIASLDLGVDVAKIRLPNSGACWTWSNYGPSHPFFAEPFESETNDVSPTSDKTSPRCLRVYFEPRELAFSQTAKFDAQEAYVSVSRREIFFSWNVLQAYLEARCLDLLAASRPETDVSSAPNPVENRLNAANNDRDAQNDNASKSAAETPDAPPRRVDFAWDADFRPFGENYAPGPASPPLDVDAPNAAEKAEYAATDPNATRRAADVCAFRSAARAFASVAPRRPIPSPPPTFVFDFDDQNIRFRFGKIAGSLVVANGETFDDAIRFSGLIHALTRLSDYIYFDPQNADPRLDENGVRLRLTPVEKERQRDANNENDDASDVF